MRQAFNLLKQHKLFSGIYILGTALTIAMTMTIFIILYVKFGPIYPEENRDRMLVVKGIKRCPKGKTDNWNMTNGHTYLFAKEHLSKLSHVDAIAISTDGYEKEKCIGSNERPVELIKCYTNGDFWRVFNFKFLFGNPYTDKDVKALANVAVVSRSVTQQLFANENAVGKTIKMKDNVSMKIVGVVDDCSPAATSCFAQIWMPLSKEYLESNNYDRFLGGLSSYLLCDDKANIPLAEQDAERMMKDINKADKEYDYFLMGQPDTFIKSTFRTQIDKGADTKEIPRGFVFLLLAILIIPSLNLSGMISSRMNGRLSELGIRKAYGATNRQLLFRVINENLLLTAIGSLAGLALSFIIVYTARQWILIVFDEEMPVWYYLDTPMTLSTDMLFNPWVFIAAVATCLLLNTASTLLPAWMALRRSIIESIHGHDK